MAMQGIKMTNTASPEEPAVAAAAPPLGDAVDDGNAILGLPAAPSYGSVLDDEDEDEDGDAYDDMSDSDSSSSSSDSDSEFEEDHGNRVRFWDGDAAAGSETDLVARPVTFLGQMARFASFQGAAGFMRLSAAQAASAGGDEEDREEGGGAMIIVHYRLTRFSRPRQSDDDDGGHGVEVREYGTALHHVRYLVPFPAAAAADAASSLRLAGAALAADVYPYRHYAQLQAVWSGLVAALPVRVPPRAARVVVTVDAGVVLRRGEDRVTPERMARVRAALAALARENDGDAPMPCGLVQHLPAPVCCDEVARPSKRRRRFAAVGEGEVCAICHETLEHGLAEWPRCSHVFHGKCLEQLLVTVQHRCPMCRSTLSIKGSSMFG